MKSHPALNIELKKKKKKTRQIEMAGSRKLKPEVEKTRQIEMTGSRKLKPEVGNYYLTKIEISSYLRSKVVHGNFVPF